MSFKLHQLGLAIAAVTVLSVAQAEDDAAATPYRPTAASPAGLSAPGWLDIEFGVQRAKGGADNWRNAYPVLAKLAFNDQWAVLLGKELAVQRTDLADQVFKGNGDTLVVLKRFIPTATEGSAFGIELGYKSPTAKTDIGGSGESDTLLNGIYSTAFAGHALDLNLGVIKIGGVADSAASYQYTWAAAVARSIDEKWGVFAALNGSAQNGSAAKSQAMAGLNYALNKRVVFDGGVASGLNADSPSWIVFAGATVLTAKLF